MLAALAALVAGCENAPPAPAPPAPAPPLPPPAAPPAAPVDAAPVDAAPVEAAPAAKLGRSWCDEIYAPFAAQVAGKYPFEPTGPDLPLSVLTEWFAHGKGRFRTFFDDAAAAEVSLDAQLPAFLDQLADIGVVMFPPGASAPKFEFDVSIDGTPGVSEITLTVDGASVSYRNGPQTWRPMSWPGTAGEPGASITAKGLGKHADVVRSGEWGFWRLLAAASLSGMAGQQVYRVKWDLSGEGIGVVTIQVRPRRDETPLFGVPGRGTRSYLGLFQPFRVPSSIVAGHACSPASKAAPSP